MALTLITNPVGSATQKLFAAFDKVEFVFKREDLSIVDTESGTNNKLKINVLTDLTGDLVAGDFVFIYSEGTNYTYSVSAPIITITASEITIDTTFIEVSTGGYINYKKNYYVNLQCVNKENELINLLGFDLKADGDAAGNIKIDVSVIGDKLTQLKAVTGFITNESQSFNVQYKEVWEGSSESYTLLDTKLLSLVYATQTPEVNKVLSLFDTPKIYLGYPQLLRVATLDLDAGFEIGITANEKNANQTAIDSTQLTPITAQLAGYYNFEFAANFDINTFTKYIDFEYTNESGFDFASPDFATPDFETT